MRLSRSTRLVACLLASANFALLSTDQVAAKSPAVIEHGKQLFEKNWTARNPSLGNDGLGPLFNGQSCVVCHSQGGIGGGGDARFNAKTIGIDRMKITNRTSTQTPVSQDIVKQAISDFHPGFIGPTGTVLNTFTIAHHGGSEQFDFNRKAFMGNLPVMFSSHGGPVSAFEVRQANATPILYSRRMGANNEFDVAIRARLYQRNTPSIFGAGLIDQITGKQITAMVKAQERHPEVSGRPATLSNGRFGRFGWRGNVPTLLDFCDQACANELGLETKRLTQPIDPTNRRYRNHSFDISDANIKAMTAFMAALPAPEREMPTDSFEREMVTRGEAVFASVGCALCHVPNMGPAKGIYSDILLHDMGSDSIDLNRADPYIIRVKNVQRPKLLSSSTSTRLQSNFTGYYSGSTDMTMSSSSGPTGSTGNMRMSGRKKRMNFASKNGYDFVAPTRPMTLVRIIDQNDPTGTFSLSDKKVESQSFSNRFRSGTRTRTTTVSATYGIDEFLRLEIEPTNFNQEWRTPPLWGVRDSAPYMHDGRAETLLEAIVMHEGEAAPTRDRFLNLSVADRQAVVAFLNTMVAPKNAPKPKL